MIFGLLPAKPCGTDPPSPGVRARAREKTYRPKAPTGRCQVTYTRYWPLSPHYVTGSAPENSASPVPLSLPPCAPSRHSGCRQTWHHSSLRCPPLAQHENRAPLRSPLDWLPAHLPPIPLCPRCDRTWHGTRRGKQTCPPCTTRPAPASGTCTNCGQTVELTPEDVCGECCLDQTLADYATRLHARGPHNHEEGTASGTDPRSTFHQRMQDTRRRAAALGLTPAGQRLAVRLAAHAEAGARPS